jgi:hypothetical protein
MARNPKNPRDYVSNPRNRFLEKINLIYEHFIQFDYSTRQLILARLNLKQDSHHYFFKNLEEKGILRRIDAYTIRCKYVYILSPIGKELAFEQFTNGNLTSLTEFDQFHDKISTFRINHSNLRHHLAVQKTIIELLQDFDQFFSEKFTPTFPLDSGNSKKPDALLISRTKKVALEVELTAKNDKRLFSALSSHAEAISKNFYDEVLYIFPSQTLMNHYLLKFNQNAWPRYKRIERDTWIKFDNLEPEIIQTVRSCFKFASNNSLVSDF